MKANSKTHKTKSNKLKNQYATKSSQQILKEINQIKLSGRKVPITKIKSFERAKKLEIGQPVNGIIRCANCNKSIQQKLSHNGDPMFSGRVCMTCNDLVLSHRLSIIRNN